MFCGRNEEHGLRCDAALTQIRQFLLKAVQNNAVGRPLPGMNGASYRVRSARFEAALGNAFDGTVRRSIAVTPPAAAE